MKKQLSNELEKEAPFRQSLKEEIINEANRLNTKRIPWKILGISGAIIAALSIFLLMNINNNIHYDHALNVDQKALDIMDEITSIEGAKLNERFFQLTDEEQQFLMNIYHSDQWQMTNEKEGYEQIELLINTPNSKELQPLVITYIIHQNHATLYTMKGKLTLTDGKKEQFTSVVKNAFRKFHVDKAINVAAIDSYQPQLRSLQNSKEKVNELKEILNSAIYSTGTVIERTNYPVSYIDLFTENNTKYRLNYWIDPEKIVIDAGTGVGEITGEAMYRFIQFLIHEGFQVSGNNE